MCGIVGGIGRPIQRAIDSLKHRGPDACGSVQRGKFWLGHTRLAILDLDSRSNQPYLQGNIALTYNGELWNYKALRQELSANHGHTFSTTGDTEVVAVALELWGTGALVRFEGMFALAWTDGDRLWLARDRFGETPLHYSSHGVAFASELRGLQAMGARGRFDWVLPGHVLTFSASGLDYRRCWYSLPERPANSTLEESVPRLRDEISRGVEERSISDVPVCALLSGGIDSTAVLYHLRQHRSEVVAYTAVHNPKSSDLKCARLAAKYFDIELREIQVPAPTASDLAGVVRRIEQPHKAQVEIGWACLHLAQRMRADGFRVTYSGEGSDELWASYRFISYHMIKRHGWFACRRDLFVGQHRKNFSRCNKVFMAHGIECRLPFLHTSLVEFALSLPQSSVVCGKNPKAVLCEAYRGLVPTRIVDRSKLAFQDGAGLKGAAAQVVSDPRRFYSFEFARAYRGQKP
jgi:asparagine synthase (glutamine-hydrolysing)